MKLYRITLIATLTCVALTLLFPFRTGIVNKSYELVEFPMGPMFVGMTPDADDIASAFLHRPIKGTFTSPVIISKIDYGRTLMFTGAISTVGLIALAITSTRNRLVGNGASQPFSDQQEQQRQQERNFPAAQKA